MTISFNSLGGYGRLGNQMFQYAALRGIAHDNGYEFSVPESGHRLFEIFTMENCKLREENKIVMQNLTHIGFEFDKALVENCPDYTDLYGYFQSERYFESISDSIRQDFTFKNPDTSLMTELRRAAEGKPVVSIHVRRGDYITLPDHHPLLTKEYYESSMSVFKDVLFVIFSDDPEWCEYQEMFDGCMVVDASDATVMYTMSQCDHNIIANSSFSWWGAWLNNNYHKVVIAPKGWFGPAYSEYDLSDLYPSRWIVL
jgi:hypothetical protein